MHFDKEQQIALLRKFRDNDDKAALNLLITSNEKLIAKLSINAQQKCGLELDDLMQEARVGMLLAAQKFNFEKETSFATYAVFWIKHRHIKYAMDNSSNLSIGKTTDSRILFLHFARNWHKISTLNIPTKAKYQMVADRLNVKYSSVVKYFNTVIKSTFRLDVKSSGDDLSNGEKVGGEDVDVAEVYEANDTNSNFHMVLSDMMENDFEKHERDIITVRYLSGDLKSYPEVARQIRSYSRQQVTNIDRALISKIRKRMMFRLDV